MMTSTMSRAPKLPNNNLRGFRSALMDKQEAKPSIKSIMKIL